MDRSRDPLRSQPFTPTTLQYASRSRSDQSRNNYAPSSRIPRSGPGPSWQQPNFPPHPSIRPPANVTASPRMPMGVGVAPRPTRNAPAAYQQEMIAKVPTGAAMPKSVLDLSQDSSYAQAAMHTPPPVPPQPPSSTRRYNMTQSYVSSIQEETPPLRQHMPPRVSHYPEDDSPKPAYPSSKIMPQFEFPTPNNRDTMDTVDSYEHYSRGPPAKPRMIDATARPPITPKPGEISPASTRAHAMNALSQAIAVGISKPVSPVTSRAPSPGVRMPFDNDQTSVHTLQLDPPDLRDAPLMPKSRLPPPENSTSPKSASSESPILGLGIGAPSRGLSTKRDATKRPPRLDIDAVREMEARGSTTSLTDLIRRATKLASNLDRGKTASRLGMLDMFGASSSSQRLGNLAPGQRDSSMSDMLSSFPAPAAGTPRSEWPTNEKGFMSSTSELARGKGEGSSSKRAKTCRRRICGMTIPCFTVVLIALILLIAAAVLIPIFLIVVPRQSNNAAAASASSCSRSDSSRCQNGGTSILANGACSCVCRGGFTGRNCENEGGASCTTQDIADGSVVYRGATMSRDVLRGFTDAGTFNIPLNATTILGLFSTNAITCDDASTLVNVSSNNSSTSDNNNNNKRVAAAQPLIMIPGLEPSEVINALHLPHITTAPTPTTLVYRKRQITDSSLQTMISQYTDLTFDASVDSFRTISTSTGTGTAAAASATPNEVTDSLGVNIAQQLAFSRVVVLYMAERSQSIAVALDTNSRLADYFRTSEDNNVVNVGQVAGQLMAVDMVRFTITDGNTRVGGGGGGGK